MSDSNVASPMARAARPFVAALALFVGGAMVVTAGTAWAGGWSDYKAAFPLFPCQDGWSGCLVDGNALTPDLGKDGSGMPLPSDFRVGWDLQPTAAFSPFVLLSPYAGKVAAAEPEPAPEAPAADPEPTPEPTPDAPADTKPDEPKPDAPKSDPKPKADPKPDAPKSDPKPVDTKPTKVGTTDPKPADAKPVPADKPSDAKSDPGTASLSPADNSCDNLTRLEPSAMLGKLSDGQIACLETSFSTAKQTEKDKVSRILMGNAYSKGDLKNWEKLMKRHLDEVDQSDPDLCYKYAQYLQKKGSADGAIKWANVALERKTVWTGDTFTQRVSALMKIRAAAAQSKWKKAEDENAAAPSPELQTKVDASRNQTKVFAREWYEYAKQTGKDASTALQLCVSAAGTKDYCEGGG